MSEKVKRSPRCQRRYEGERVKGKNKRALSLHARQRGYFRIIEKMGYSGSDQLSSLPKRWGAYNRPGTT